MATQAIAFNEIEWRSAAVTASAGRVISAAVHHARLGVRHYQILSGLNTVADSMRELLRILHSDTSIAVLEAATPEQRATIGKMLQESHDKLQMMVATLRTKDLGYWRRLYTPKIEALEASNREYAAHSEALRDVDAELLVLSQNDQKFLINALLTPKEPSEDLYRVFARK
jgi:hypothetical protein